MYYTPELIPANPHVLSMLLRGPSTHVPPEASHIAMSILLSSFFQVIDEPDLLAWLAERPLVRALPVH